MLFGGGGGGRRAVENLGPLKETAVLKSRKMHTLLGKSCVYCTLTVCLATVLKAVFK